MVALPPALTMIGEQQIPFKDVPPLDPSFFQLEQDEEAFFKSLTGIQDDDELKKHIIEAQSKAYRIFNYPCIRGFAFTKLKISRVPAYPDILRLHNERQGAILLDVGCCFGNDLRKAVFDGWPAEYTIGLDIEPAFWKYGHELFRSTPQSFPAAFVCGNVFDPSIIQLREPCYVPPATPRPESLQGLKSLNPLQGHISAIHVTSVFHLFGEEDQLLLAKLLTTLLSPEPGSVIFGAARGMRDKDANSDFYSYPMVCHSPESWRELWDGQVFEKGMVRVDAELVDANRKDVDMNGELLMLVWSITRL